MSSDDVLDALMAESSPVGVSRSSGAGGVASSALDAFLVDHRRLRTQELDGEMVAFVITSKPDGCVAPTVHAGVEPEKVIESSASLVPAIDARRVLEGREHRCWVLRVGRGLLIRIWLKKPDEARNSEVAYWAVKPGGECKRIDEITYRRLTKALAGSCAR